MKKETKYVIEEVFETNDLEKRKEKLEEIILRIIKGSEMLRIA
ncbi:MAG: hypothetical protein N2645_18360 [Clostridia bacterium]|nr:hypothetical protein [Clostridia bacterium]